jgi:hypothetical protein
MNPTSKKTKELKIRGFAISILSTLFILSGSLIIYYFSKGYRLNISGREIKKTGVLTVQTEPSAADLYINDNSVGRTPRSRTLDVGIHTISIWKDGYREWRKEVEVLEEKSTPIYPFLILENIKKTTVWQATGIIEKYWSNETKDTFVFLQKDSEESFSVWTYRINTSLWNLTPNPIEVLQINTDQIELTISPSGQVAIAQINLESGNNIYLVELLKNNNLSLLNPLDISDFSNYQITWAKDNRYLLLESNEDIISYDTSRGIRYLLLKKSIGNEYIWSTDEEGFFYIIEPLHTEEDQTYIYGLKQSKLDGTNAKYTIEKAFFQKEEKYIQHYRENGMDYPEFSNSPESTQSIGRILDFEVNQTSKGVYIKTETSSYWYDIQKNKYQMISPFSTDIVGFSPDSKKILFLNGDSIFVFTLDKEEADHTEKIGSKKVEGLVKDNVSNLQWLSNSYYIAYKMNNYLFISEKDGGNPQSILSLENVLLQSIKSSREHIVTLEKNEDGTFSINLYKIK